MMRTIYSSELISKNRVGNKIDCPSDIEYIVNQLKCGENVNKKYLKDHIFMLRNFCAPYSQDIYDRIMSLFDAYETLFSMEKFKNEMKVKQATTAVPRCFNSTGRCMAETRINCSPRNDTNAK